MPDKKVVCFPGKSIMADTALSELWPTHQPSLFDHEGKNRGKIVFLDIVCLSEESLLSLVTRNGVTALVDLRPRPVFERPRFKHRQVVQYFYSHNIKYIEYVVLMKNSRENELIKSNRMYEDKFIRNILKQGLIVCLYDEGARKLGWLEDIRSFVRASPTYFIELHPRALSGA